jgi:hypothetical protein
MSAVVPCKRTHPPDDGRIGGLDSVDGGGAGYLGAGLASAENARYANMFVDAVAQICRGPSFSFKLPAMELPSYSDVKST